MSTHQQSPTKSDKDEEGWVDCGTPCHQLFENEGPHVHTIAVQNQQLFVRGQAHPRGTCLMVAINLSPQTTDRCRIAAETVEERPSEVGA
jgi:hypothetical protein